jgi:hypothetical protein
MGKWRRPDTAFIGCPELAMLHKNHKFVSLRRHLLAVLMVLMVFLRAELQVAHDL